MSGYIMLLPEILVFTVFLVYPLIRGIFNSFYSFKGPTPVWTGLANFGLVFHDDLFWIALKNTTVYTVLVVPGGILVALATSWLIYPLRDRAQTFYKGAFYLPGVVSGVVVALSWKWIFEPTSGLFNYGLSLVHLGPVPWLTSPNTALYSLILMVIMGGQGASIVIILANMMAISQSIFESARLDGC
ncbi:MAG TPA: sugar ABC transporter permease, partial [Spirochaetia bacterium]|nr:sugar ABC transporter permease [Spirochaetia bacterium]